MVEKLGAVMGLPTLTHQCQNLLFSKLAFFPSEKKDKEKKEKKKGKKTPAKDPASPVPKKKKKKVD